MKKLYLLASLIHKYVQLVSTIIQLSISPNKEWWDLDPHLIKKKPDPDSNPKKRMSFATMHRTRASKRIVKI